MSKKEEEPLYRIKENEELILEELPGKENEAKPRQDNGPGSPLIRAVRRGSSSTSLFFQETSLNALDVEKTDNFQRNVFHYAVSKPDALRTILNQLKTKTCVQEALNEAEDEGKTPIHSAASIINAEKTRVQEALTQADDVGETPIHRAASIPNIESLEILTEYDNSLMKLKTTVQKRSVLHVAVKSRSEIAVKFVLGKDPDLINSVDILSQTPVHYAASLKQSSILDLLLTKGCDTAAVDKNGQLPIHIAASKGVRSNVELLLRDDPDFIDKVNNFNQSPLILAAKNGFSEVVSYLLSKNADYALMDKAGLKAFDWAVKRTIPDVVEVFLEKNVWREVVSKSCYGPEGCLTTLLRDMPEMAKLLLDKCLTIKGSKDHPASYQVLYDFFCLESKDEKGDCPRFEALDMMAENVSEIGLSHPVVVKYVDKKWRKRGFKVTLALILATLLFHICLMIYTTRVIGVVNRKHERRERGGVNTTMNVPRREGRPPNADEMMALRVVLLIITFASMLKEVLEIMVLRFKYFLHVRHYYRLALFISVTLYLLPVEAAITVEQLQFGAVTVLLSWVNLLQFLQLIPVLGAYIIVVQKVFWTLMKICVVVAIYLLSFATTFYILLAEHDSFRDIWISFVSTFVAMMDGFSYEDVFVTVGWYPRVYELKLTVLVLFILTMSIVVNNTLIGLAVGDANEVMESAHIDRFRRRAKFVVQLERGLDRIPYLKSAESEDLIEFPLQKKNVCEKILDFLYFGNEHSEVDGPSVEDGDENELDAIEDSFERVVEIKLENLRLNMRRELKEIQSDIKKDFEEKLGKILETLK